MPQSCLLNTCVCLIIAFSSVCSKFHCCCPLMGLYSLCVAYCLSKTLWVWCALFHSNLVCPHYSAFHSWANKRLVAKIVISKTCVQLPWALAIMLHRDSQLKKDIKHQTEILLCCLKHSAPYMSLLRDVSASDVRMKGTQIHQI